MAGPVVIITGASRGIGKSAVIQSLTKFNARVVAVARSSELLQGLQAEAAQLGKQDALEIVAGDVTDERVVHSIVERAIDRWGQLDSVVANAGILEPIASVAEGSVQAWKRLFDVNFFSIITLVQQSLPHLRKTHGSIIMVSSGAASKGYRGWGAYGSSKAALNHLASTLSVEEPDVTTIALRPGVVDTDMQGLIRAEGQPAMQDNYKKFVDLHREGKLLPPDVPGHIIAALAAKAPRALSGSFCSWDDDVLKEYRA